MATTTANKPIGYESDALSFKDTVVRLVSELMKTIAMKTAAGSGAPTISEDDMKRAADVAIAILDKHLNAAKNPDEFIAAMKEEIAKNSSPDAK